MTAIIDYFFVGASPFVYFGQGQLIDIAAKHGAKIMYRPFDIAAVWAKSGSIPLGERTPTRKRYRLLELQRIAFRRDMKINLQPKHFPVDTTLADCCTIVIAERGNDPDPFMRAVSRGIWVEDADLGDEHEVAERLAACNVDPDTVLSVAKDEATRETRQANTRMAIEMDAVGAPAYVLNGEVFWGQDRLDDLDLALESGREPFTAKLD